LTWEKFWRHLLSWQLWVYGFMFLCCSAPIYAFAYFIQTILKTMGYSTAVVFLLVSDMCWALSTTKTNDCKCAPPYLFGAIWTVVVAWAADKTKLRMPYMVLNAIITHVGLLLTAYCKVGDAILVCILRHWLTEKQNNGVRYFGIFLGVSGCNGNLPTIIAFQSNNVRSDNRRSVGSGLQFAFAAIGGIYASCTFMQKEAPSYRTGVWCAVVGVLRDQARKQN
jgi:hypothetical protein